MNRTENWNMSPFWRKFALSAHVTSSIGWFGAVAVFLALAIAGFTSKDIQIVRAAYIAMNLSAWLIIVPLALASPLTGVLQSLGTHWGLFRHYWVLIKFLITIPATLILLVHLMPIERMAGAVSGMPLPAADFHKFQIQLIANAVAALLVLLVATILSIYKPKGMTAYGRRRISEGTSKTNIDQASQPENSAGKKSLWKTVFGVILSIGLLIFVIMHLMGGGLGNH